MSAALDFKAYVHGRLDNAGVPVDPPGPHRDAGCRIGQRLDHLLDERTALKAKLDAVTEVLAALNGALDEVAELLGVADQPKEPSVLADAIEQLKKERDEWKATALDFAEDEARAVNHLDVTRAGAESLLDLVGVLTQERSDALTREMEAKTQLAAATADAAPTLSAEVAS